LSSDEETYDEEEEEETKLLNAEQVTMIASSFLKRLGNKQGLKPIKASLEEDDIYTVEIGLPKKTAIVQINAATEKIEEYEIKKIEQQEEASSFPVPLTPKNIMILGGTAAASVVLSALLGISAILPSLF
jgi:hypothetical protein